jgi:DNA invertase Pin-like site-specific DNA recombinase
MTIMSGIAEFERELIRERREEGIERAKRKGAKFGRPSALDAGQRRRIAERYTEGETMTELAGEYRRTRQQLRSRAADRRISHVCHAVTTSWQACPTTLAASSKNSI